MFYSIGFEVSGIKIVMENYGNLIHALKDFALDYNSLQR